MVKFWYLDNMNRALRQRLKKDAQSLRVIKLEPRKAGSFLEGLRRLGRVPAGPRDKRPVKAINEEPQEKLFNS